MKKRWISLLLAMAMVAAMVPQMALEVEAATSGTCGDNLMWVLNDEGTLTISGTGPMWEYGYMKDGPWFDSIYPVRSVVIETGVTTIGYGAFSDCYELESVSIPNTVTLIDGQAFSLCYSLRYVSIPSSITQIEDWAFFACDSLERIDVDENNPAYCNDDAGVLYSKDRAVLIHAPGMLNGTYAIPNGTRTIAEVAFYSCRYLTGITIPSSVTAIEDLAFGQCLGLRNVYIPASVVTLGDEVFNFCTALEGIWVDAKNPNYCNDDFGVLFNLEKTTLLQAPGAISGSYRIPSGVTTIGYGAFEYCDSLTNVTIPNSVISIESGAFSLCDNLTSVTIPSSVTRIGSYAFGDCNRLTAIWVSADNPCYSSDYKGVLLNKEQTEILQVPQGLAGEYTVPGGVRFIDEGAFAMCYNLTSIAIPNGVTNIGNSVFSGCTSLRTVTIPGSITAIGEYAFDWCNSLTDVYFIGTEAQWRSIAIGSDNECLTNATIHFNASVPNWDTYVDLNADVNSFSHRGMKYEISNVLYRGQLFSGEDLIQRLVISNELNSDEVKGYCHGLAASICLGSKGMIDFSSLPGRNGGKAHNYYSLLAPDSTVPETGLINAALRDLLIYYQLTQFTTLGQETKSVTNSGLAKEWRLEWFLSDLVAEAIRSEEKEAPFIFSYRYYDLDINGTHITDNGTDIIHGHSVVVCGYNWNDEIKQHEIQIYDENCTGEEYYVLSVSEDYTSFSFVDANSRRRQNMGYATYMLEDKWVELRYYGISKVYSFINIVPMPVSIGESEETTTDLIVSANTSFKITNAEGESVVYTSGVFSGTMNISDVKFYGSETDPYWVLSVMPSEYFVLTETSGDCNMVVEIDGKEYSACCDGANSVTFSKDGVVVKGERVEYDIVMIPNISDVDMVRMKGTSTSNTTFCYSNSQKQNITVTSDSEMENIEVYGYTYFSPESVRVSESDTYMVVESTEEDGAAVVVDDIEMQMSSKDNPFTDVPPDTFYYEPVLWALENGITTGATATTFNPNGKCQRAQVVTFLHRAAGNPVSNPSRNPFTDVKSSDFFYKPVLWAVEEGITNGISATSFGSYDVCNRAAFVTFLWRAAGEPEPKSTNNPFVDVKSTDFFYKPVLWAVEEGVTNGVDATHFGPAGACNRAQVVTFLYRAYN